MSKSHGLVPYKGGTEGAGISLVKKSVRSNTVGAYVYLKRRCKDA